MMNWKRLGLVYNASGNGGWDLHSALTPTPFIMEDRVRIYAGFRDEAGVSRIGYVDLDAGDPTKIIGISKQPALDIGRPGSFDDNGVILGDVLKVGDAVHMYYVGFQLVKNVKFLAFTGLAISTDGGETFSRVSDVPVLDRMRNELYFNAVHTVLLEDGKFKFWLGAGSAWEIINNTPYPSYTVKYIESGDGIHFHTSPVNCLSFSRNKEYRIGRPRVYRSEDGYFMIFTWGDLDANYQMGYAHSADGMNWTRDDSIINFRPSESGWDSHSVSYGALFHLKEDTYMVYNGNDMGRDGFGLALLVK